MAFAVGSIMGGIFAVYGADLATIYSNDPEVIYYAARRMAIVCPFYCISGMVDCLTGLLRGLGQAFITLCIMIFTVCVLRVVYIYTFFEVTYEKETSF